MFPYRHRVCVCCFLFIMFYILSLLGVMAPKNIRCTEMEWTSSFWSKAWIWTDIVIADRWGELRLCKNEDEKWEIEAIFVASSWDNDVANGMDTFDCNFHVPQMTWNSACVRYKSIKKIYSKSCSNVIIRVLRKEATNKIPAKVNRKQYFRMKERFS